MIGFHSPTNRRPLTRQEAARVLAAPLPKSTSGRLRPIAMPLAVGGAIAAIWIAGTIVACDLAVNSREDFSANLQKAIILPQKSHNGGG